MAGRAGITLHETAGTGADSGWRSELLGAMAKPCPGTTSACCRPPTPARPATTCARGGYDGAVVRQFKLGWAPDDWDALSSALKLSEKVLTGTGLGFVNRRGRRQDAFRNRIIFPIFDPSGRPVALGGRILPARPGARSRTRTGGPSPSTRTPRRRSSTRSAAPCMASTGPRRTWWRPVKWSCARATPTSSGSSRPGCPEPVATCGTALAEEHFRVLRNFGRKIVLAYDADSAGQTATARVYEWERRHEVDVAVATLPPGTDPGELAAPTPRRSPRRSPSPPVPPVPVDRVCEGPT